MYACRRCRIWMMPQQRHPVVSWCGAASTGGPSPLERRRWPSGAAMGVRRVIPPPASERMLRGIAVRRSTPKAGRAADHPGEPRGDDPDTVWPTPAATLRTAMPDCVTCPAGTSHAKRTPYPGTARQRGHWAPARAYALWRSEYGLNQVGPPPHLKHADGPATAAAHPPGGKNRLKPG